MGIRLVDLMKDERELEIETGKGEVLNVVYRPSSITPETQDLYFELLEKNRVGSGLAGLMLSRLVSWDLEDDEGEVMEISLESLRQIPIDILDFISSAIVADMAAGAEDRKNSGGGSRRKGKSASRRRITG